MDNQTYDKYFKDCLREFSTGFIHNNTMQIEYKGELIYKQ